MPSWMRGIFHKSVTAYDCTFHLSQHCPASPTGIQPALVVASEPTATANPGMPISSDSLSSTSTLKGNIFPSLLFVNGAERKELTLSLQPFSVGRKTGKNLEIPDPRISRDHAEIICEEGEYYIID